MRVIGSVAAMSFDDYSWPLRTGQAPARGSDDAEAKLSKIALSESA
jgi:hypothetical protein